VPHRVSALSPDLPTPDLEQLRARSRPFEAAERALVRSVVSLPRWIPEADEHVLRYALNLARLSRVRADDGRDLDLEAPLAAFRAELAEQVEPVLLRPEGVDRAGAVRLASQVLPRARAARELALQAAGGKLSPEALDREVCEKALVLVCGGGGGVSYVFLGGFWLLEQYGLTPRLMAGSSMGSILLLFRARRLRFDPEEIAGIVGGLSFRTLFRFLDVESRYALPGAIRLYLRAGIGDFMAGPGGDPLTLGQLPIPLLVTVTGIRTGALPHDPSYYEHLLDLHGRAPRPNAVKRIAKDLVGALSELVAQRERFTRLYLGLDEETRDFDAVDAVGFSSALPGVLHYDVVREDQRMHQVLRALFERHDLFRLMDGGIADNVPARAAWQAVQDGRLGTRNAFVLAFDGFAPKLTQPLWFSVERLVAQNVARNLPFIDHQRSFQQVLSPVELLPGLPRLRRAIQWGKEELLADMPFVARMVRPFPPLAGAPEPGSRLR
jgi:predicted acylesterase/phospholipase RssA